ncbi:LacI family DNA-binding transcriptional regulator [Paraburkholderia sp. Tr-20389]|uniref:LacI family DNA-binding transcriptional regulator n=1 Tax=Paraburkholderia sp. Tr-20389 TaxID=2703903 RepID=UPI00197ED54D|nr:LacI family DNA-binding transcriptional regulator [Paraburkholderia sp. Tr-20389]MBN3753751.1 LacI family DNA-binding transcriptional regulator [Paraburkholderia sp. Tr-20389]
MTEKEKKHWVTAADVARRAGVSRSAVSRAFSPTASIAPETRELVMETARALGYQVNMIAREMIMQRSTTVGVVTAGFENPFRAKLLAQIITALSRHSLTPLVVNAEDPRQIGQSLEMLLSYRIAGVIMTSASPPVGLARQYLDSRVPVMLINRAEDLPGADLIVSDNAAGATAAVRALADSGAKRLVFVGPTKTSYSARARNEGFTRAGKRLGKGSALNTATHVSTSDTYECGVAAAHALLEGKTRPDGVFCSSDLLALGFIDTARLHYGLHVPGDLSVIGFDDIPASGYENYQLTTIRQDAKGLADAAIDMLLDRIDAPSAGSRTRVVPVEYVMRKTCG